MSRKRKRKLAAKQPAVKCVTCQGPIPKSKKALWYFDKATGAIYGCHLNQKCQSGYEAALKASMTWGAWARYCWLKRVRGAKRVTREFAQRWTSERWQRRKLVP